MHANPSGRQIAANEAELDGIIAVLEPPNSDASALLLEHLKCAKMYLQGSMPEEYFVELDMARETAAGLPDHDLRRSTSNTIKHLRDELTASDAARQARHFPIRHRLSQEPSGKGRLWDFFGAAPLKMGTFYPTGFVAAVLPSYTAAEDARQALRATGFADRDVIAARGEEMSAFLDELRARSGVWGRFMGALSRLLGTEQLFTDSDTELARNHAGFLLVYSPDETETGLTRGTIEPFAPISMQRYLAGAVESLIKPPGAPGPER